MVLYDTIGIYIPVSRIYILVKLCLISTSGVILWLTDFAE